MVTMGERIKLQAGAVFWVVLALFALLGLAVVSVLPWWMIALVVGAGLVIGAVTFLPRWLPFGRGDYWVLDLDDDYRVAVIGVPGGSAGWILAREPRIGEDELARALRVLEANGYDTGRIEMTVQPAG